MEGNISLTDEEYTRLYKHRNTFRKLATKQVDRFTKRQLLGKHSSAIKDLLDTFLYHYSEEDSQYDNNEIEDSTEDESDNSESDHLQETLNTTTEDYGRESTVSNFDSRTSVPLPPAAPEAEGNSGKRN